MKTLVLVVMIIFCLVLPATCEVRYTVTELDGSTAIAVNRHGWVIGSNDSSRSTLWRNDKAIVIGDRFGFPRTSMLPISDANALAINDAGVMAGYVDTASSTSVWTSSAFVFHGGSATDLGSLGGSVSYAMDINSSGKVVGTSTLTPGVFHYHAFLWDRHEGMVDLGDLDDKGSIASCINDLDQIAGWTQWDQGFVWTKEYGMRMLDMLPGKKWMQAYDINNSGQVVGGCWGLDYPSTCRAFVWSKFEGISELPASGCTYSTAECINNQGQIAGVVVIGGSSKAVLWDAGVMKILDDVIPSDFGLKLAAVNGINDSGQIVGYGWRNGVARAFLLTPVKTSRERRL